MSTYYTIQLPRTMLLYFYQESLLVRVGVGRTAKVVTAPRAEIAPLPGQALTDEEKNVRNFRYRQSKAAAARELFQGARGCILPRWHHCASRAEWESDPPPAVTMDSLVALIDRITPEVAAKFHFEAGVSPLSTIESPAIAVVAYLAVIGLLKTCIHSEIKIRPIEIVHNLVLTTLSVTMLVNIVLAAIRRAADEGFVHGVACSQRKPEHIWDGPLGFWTYVFYLSKFYELLDTVILCIRAKSLIFLHVFHHAVMTFVCWSWFAYPWMAGAWWCTMVNSAIHTAMYYYYLQTTLGRKVWWKKYLTSAQIVQFCTGLVFVGLNVFYHFTLDSGCTENLWTSLFSTSVNVSFILLFAAFYKRNYSKAPVETADKKAK
eukprot:m.165239 g.165239  ORF g.165239 m.165239 type:complete len:375 (+) comp10326_c0_seq1:1203-2327(+)